MFGVFRLIFAHAVQPDALHSQETVVGNLLLGMDAMRIMLLDPLTGVVSYKNP